jgi:hypothetical protein
MQVNCWLTLTDQPGIYSVDMEFPHELRRVAVGKTNLHADCELDLLKEKRTLQQVLDLLDRFDTDDIKKYTDDAGMHDIGRFLYQATVGKYTGHELMQEGIDFRIISTCEHIHRLPWSMLARDEDILFLRQCDWQITLAREHNDQSITLPSLPSILVFSPEEIDDDRYGKTGTDEHIKALQNMLQGEIFSYKDSKLFRLVRTPVEVERALKRQHFDVLYYYGHGEGDGLSSCLRLQAETEEKPHSGTMSLMQLRELMSHAVGGAPKLCYINACNSASGGKMGAGLQLGNVCAAVVANRTEAWVSVAQRQGIEFLKKLILDAIPPHEALHRTISSVHEDARDLSWATPILTRHYTDWQCERQPSLHHLNRQDKDWRVKLDRTMQSGLLNEFMKAVLNGNVDTLCCLWYGTKEDLVDMLHERIQHTVPDTFDLIPCNLSWDNYLISQNNKDHYQPHVFRQSLLAAFHCSHHSAPNSIESIPRFLKEISLHYGSHGIIFHLRLQITRPASQDWAIPIRLRAFLNWWQEEVAPKFKQARIPTVMTMAYELGHEHFQKLEKQFEKNLKELSKNEKEFMIELLPPLSSVNEDDIYRFIKIYGLPIPQYLAEREVPEIIKQTKGAYQKALDRLINLYEHGERLPPNISNHDTGDDDDDYF